MATIGHGEPYQAPYNLGPCAQCGQPIKRRQFWFPVDGGKVHAEHEDCEARESTGSSRLDVEGVTQSGF